MIVRLLHAGVLARNGFANGGGEFFFLHRFFILGDSRIFAAFALGQNGVIVLARDRRFQIDPGPMHCSGRAAAILRLRFAQADCFILEFAREFCALQ